MEVTLLELLRCRGVSRLIARDELDDAPLLRRVLATLHLLICRHCRFYLRQLWILKRAARIWSDGLLKGFDLAAFEKNLAKKLRSRKT